jgi:hypothetical protein
MGQSRKSPIPRGNDRGARTRRNGLRWFSLAQQESGQEMIDEAPMGGGVVEFVDDDIIKALQVEPVR